MRDTTFSSRHYYRHQPLVMNTFQTLPITIREQIYHELLTYTPAGYNDPYDSDAETGSVVARRTRRLDVPPQASAPSSPLCKLLTLSRQINAEIFQFLRLQLCVVVKSNHPKFLRSIFDKTIPVLPGCPTYNSRGRRVDCPRVPLISQLQSCDEIVKKDFSGFPVAMELEFYTPCPYRNRSPMEDTSCFLLPASSLPILIRIGKNRRNR